MIPDSESPNQKRCVYKNIACKITRVLWVLEAHKGIPKSEPWAKYGVRVVTPCICRH